MSSNEVEIINSHRMINKYDNGSVMNPLKESPGFVIIEPTKVADGYWDYEKMSTQAQDVMHSLDVLHPNVQQLHQYDWSSGHAKSREGGLLISNMNLNYGGAAKKLRDSILTDDDVGVGEAFLYKIILEDSAITWTTEEPFDLENKKVIKIDCRVRVGEIQAMSFELKLLEPPPPFNILDAPYEDKMILDTDGNISKTKTGKERKIKGYTGEAKGLAQVLWERGLWKPGMKKN